MSNRPDRTSFFDARYEHYDAPVTISGLTLANPIMPASGCFGPELATMLPIREIGAVVTKTVFAQVRGGNPVHRLTENPVGVVNSVGIPSLGPDGYLKRQHPAYRALGVPVIVSVGGHRPAEYGEVLATLGDSGDAYELNVSCPNLENGGRDIGADPDAIIASVESARRETDRPLIVKLPPMVASIADVALAAEAGGADAVCVSNSVPVLTLDRPSRLPSLGNQVGGLTGPAIRPLVSRLVWQAAEAVRIPVIACGGIVDADDVLDYLSLGAAAVQVGTATFTRPHVMVQIARDLASRSRSSYDEMLAMGSAR